MAFDMGPNAGCCRMLVPCLVHAPVSLGPYMWAPSQSSGTLSSTPAVPIPALHARCAIPAPNPPIYPSSAVAPRGALQRPVPPQKPSSRGPKMHWRGGGYPPCPPGRPIYAQLLSP